MRCSIVFVSALLMLGCSSKTAREADAGTITRLGVIAFKEDVGMHDVEQGSGGSTSVYGGISSGGRSSVGIGIVLLPSSLGGSDPDPLRYEINLLDGGQMTIYHDSRDFEVDDCVTITVYPDQQNHSPTMKRNKGGC